MIDKELHEKTIEGYLRTIEAIRQLATVATAKVKGASVEDTRKLWSWLRTARVFEVPSEVLTSWTKNILDEMTADWPKSREFYDVHDDSMKLTMMLSACALHQELPEKRAFDCMYIGYGTGSVVKKKSIPIEGWDEKWAEASLIAHLVTRMTASIEAMITLNHRAA